MKLYEAIDSIIKEFGKEIVTNSRVVNIFGDYNAFEESKTFKVIIKNIISEGYMDQLMYVRDWNMSKDRIINNFVGATGFNEANASYVFKSLAFGLGYTKEIPVFNSQQSGQASSSGQSNPNNTNNNSHSKSSCANPSNLSKTASQVERMSETAFQKYKDEAESYLESVVEFKTDIEKELGVKITSYMEFDQFANILPKFEIDGKIKVKFNYSIMLYVLVYNTSNKLINRSEIYAGMKKNSFEVVQTCISPSEYHKVSNIQRIVVYWETN